MATYRLSFLIKATGKLATVIEASEANGGVADQTPKVGPDIRDLASPDCWHQWALGYSESKEYLRAAEFFRHAVALNPRNPLLRFDFGIALVKAGLFADANIAFSDAARLDPSWDEPQKIRREVQNKISASPSIRFQPLFSPQASFGDEVDACCDLVMAVERLWPPHLVNAELKTLAAVHRGNAGLQVAVARRLAGVAGVAHRRQRDWMTIEDAFAAKKIALAAMAQRPTYESFLTAAQILQVLGDHDHAFVIMERCLQQRRNDIDAMLTLGELQLEMGQIDDGVKMVQRVIDQKPTHGRANFMLAKASPADEPGRSIRSLRQRLSDDSVVDHDRRMMQYALALRLEQSKDYDAAFAAYSGASADKKRAMLESVGKPEDSLARAHATIAAYGREFFQQREHWGISSDRPIFIIGMPRSGTTLTEQIIASHPEVYGAGELHDISILGRRVAGQHQENVHDAGREAKELPYPAGLDRITRSETRELAVGHLSALSLLNRNARYVVDKMPTNFQLLGLIQLLYPNAKIVHCTRNLLDTCVSCYRNNFSWPFFDLNGLADYAQSYRLLMCHWERVLRFQLFEMSYEDTIDDVEQQARRLLAHIDLPWSDDCLSFYETSRGVRTPSRTQVRQPIYRSSLGAWKRFEKQLGVLIERFPDQVN